MSLNMVPSRYFLKVHIATTAGASESAKAYNRELRTVYRDPSLSPSPPQGGRAQSNSQTSDPKEMLRRLIEQDLQRLNEENPDGDDDHGKPTVA
jgi:hypothetical protein